VARVALEHVGKVYPDGTRAVTDLNLVAEDGEFLVLVGPSGCGKTTALRMVAGLEDISEGELLIGDRVVNNTPSRDRDVAMVFQSYALYPHLSVRENIGFGLSLRKVPKTEIKKQVEHAADILGLTDYLDRKPRNLSGGQRQRVAMGRAIVRHPQAFLMDEPLSNLDAKLRVQTRAEIARLQHDLGVTTIYVTHDQTEAMTLGDRVAVMKSGVLQQVAPPQELYDKPVNIFVGGFMGSPAMNMVIGKIEKLPRKGLTVTVGSSQLSIDPSWLAERPGVNDHLGQDVVIGFRPEDLEDAALLADPDESRILSSTADLVEAMGSDVLAHFGIDAPPVLTDDTRELARHAGQELSSEPAGRSELIARLSPRTVVKEGDPLRVVVDTSRLHVFDPGTGLSVWGAETKKSEKGVA
jgi:multiple sugar transport system ATP-binding protein